MKILIIEDEQLTAEDLAETIVKILHQAEIVEILPLVKKAVDFLNKKPEIDLIFSDIQLQDGQSFEIFKQILISKPIIFCTAYNEYALDAIKNNGIDYLLKPFSEKTVAEALQKYQNLKNNFTSSSIQFEKLESLLKNFETKPVVSSLLVYHKNAILPIRLSDIAIFYIHHELTHLLTINGNVYTLDQTLEQLENTCGNQFFRINRQQLINRQAIAETQHHFNRKLIIKLKTSFDEEIIVSKNKVNLYLDWLTK